MPGVWLHWVKKQMSDDLDMSWIMLMVLIVLLQLKSLLTLVILAWLMIYANAVDLNPSRLHAEGGTHKDCILLLI